MQASDNFLYHIESSKIEAHNIIGSLLEINALLSQKIRNASSKNKSFICIDLQEAGIISRFILEKASELSGHIIILNQCLIQANIQQRVTELLYIDLLREKGSQLRKERNQ